MECLREHDLQVEAGTAAAALAVVGVLDALTGTSPSVQRPELDILLIFRFRHTHIEDLPIQKQKEF